MRRGGVIFAASILILASCASETRDYQVDGVRGKFCIPAAQAIEDIRWLPEGESMTSSGFSFTGCATSRARNSAACQLPKQIVSVDVEPLSSYTNQTWGVLRESAILTSMLAKSSTSYQEEVPSYMVISNPNVWKEWFIFHKRSDDLVGKNGISNLDTLVASCALLADFPESSGAGFDGEYGCRRRAKGTRYAIDYRFVSNLKVPTGTQQLDVEIFNQIDKWYCSD